VIHWGIHELEHFQRGANWVLYHILGFASAALFLLTWLGLWSQIKAMTRFQVPVSSESDDANHSLSLNQFGSSYFAFFSIFLFGISVEPFNHYLVWTRFGALILTLIIIWKIWQHRRTTISGYVAAVALLALIGGTLSIAFRPFPTLAQLGANTLMLVVTVILFQGPVVCTAAQTKSGVAVICAVSQYIDKRR
jgi:hypothetical protein